MERLEIRMLELQGMVDGYLRFRGSSSTSGAEVTAVQVNSPDQSGVAAAGQRDAIGVVGLQGTAAGRPASYGPAALATVVWDVGEEMLMYDDAVSAAEAEYHTLAKQGLCQPDSQGWITLPSGARCTQGFKNYMLASELELRRWRYVLELGE